jgi:hypothetical protein
MLQSIAVLTGGKAITEGLDTQLKKRTSGRAAQIQSCGWAAGAGLFGAASSCCVWPFWTESMLPWSEPGLRSKLWS